MYLTISGYLTMFLPIHNYAIFFRKFTIKRSAGKSISEEVHYLYYILENCSVGDYFVLLQMSKHCKPETFREFIKNLRTEMVKKNTPSR